MTIEPRGLSATERALLVRLLESTKFSGATELAAQVDATRVTGGLPTLLDLEVTVNEPRAQVSDGPIPLRAHVESPDGEVEGEILVWVTDGYLSGLEFAWVTGAPPVGMPPPERVRVDRPA